MSHAPERQPYARIPVDDDGLTVGVVPVRGGGLRVGMMIGGRLALMSPAKARRLAKDFETPAVIAADLGWVAQALRESADTVEASGATKQ